MIRKFFSLLFAKKQERDEFAHMKPIEVEIPTLQALMSPELIAGMNKLSLSVSKMDGLTITWEFETMLLATKACLLVHRVSAGGNLMSHRLLCGGVPRMQHGSF